MQGLLGRIRPPCAVSAHIAAIPPHIMSIFSHSKSGTGFCILPRFLRLFFLVKHLFDLIEEPLALLVIFLLGAAVKLLQKLLLLLGEVLRDLDRHPDVLVAEIGRAHV